MCAVPDSCRLAIKRQHHPKHGLPLGPQTVSGDHVIGIGAHTAKGLQDGVVEGPGPVQIICSDGDMAEK